LRLLDMSRMVLLACWLFLLQKSDGVCSHG
jgi:hypothetical protein